MLILCIDDDPIAVSVRKQTLETFGFHVLTATGEKDALKLLPLNRVELVLCDHFLTKGTSAGLISKIKAIRPEIPVAVYSGIIEPTELGAADFFISKLTAPCDLAEKLRLIVDRSPVEPSTAT